MNNVKDDNQNSTEENNRKPSANIGTSIGKWIIIIAASLIVFVVVKQFTRSVLRSDALPKTESVASIPVVRAQGDFLSFEEHKKQTLRDESISSIIEGFKKYPEVQDKFLRDSYVLVKEAFENGFDENEAEQYAFFKSSLSIEKDIVRSNDDVLNSFISFRIQSMEQLTRLDARICGPTICIWIYFTGRHREGLNSNRGTVCGNMD